MKLKLSTSLATLLIFLPLFVSAAGLVPCGGGGVEPACDFNQLMIMVNNIISFLLFNIAIPLAALGFMISGALLVFNQNKSGALSEAKGRMWDILVGFFWILSGFLLVKVILYSFLNTEAGFTTFLMD